MPRNVWLDCDPGKQQSRFPLFQRQYQLRLCLESLFDPKPSMIQGTSREQMGLTVSSFCLCILCSSLSFSSSGPPLDPSFFFPLLFPIGHDDAVALLLALELPEINLLGVSTVRFQLQPSLLFTSHMTELRSGPGLFTPPPRPLLPY